MGIIFAILALFSWGLGDFLIQKSTRRIGDLTALFFISAFASVILLPFVCQDLGGLVLNGKDLLLFLVVGSVALVTAILIFKALKIGKICVIEPIFALELPVIAILAALVINEFLNLWQILLIIALLLGIFLVTSSSFCNFKNIKLEKGVWYALFGTIGMGATSFLFGVGARQTNPLLINWFTSFFILLALLIYFLFSSRGKEVFDKWRENKKLILGVGFIDNLAWVAYAYSTLYIPIAVASGISQGYIALAAILGLAFNRKKFLGITFYREKLKFHQWFGLVITVVAVVFLAVITEK